MVGSNSFAVRPRHGVSGLRYARGQAHAIECFSNFRCSGVETSSDALDDSLRKSKIKLLGLNKPRNASAQ